MSGLALIIGGAGRLGVPIAKAIFDYLREKQEIQKLKIQAHVAKPCTKVKFTCNYSPEIKASKTQDLKKETKKFKFVIAIFVIAIFGIGVDIILRAILIEGTLLQIKDSLFLLREASYEILEFAISWTMTGNVVDKINFRK